MWPYLAGSRPVVIHDADVEFSVTVALPAPRSVQLKRGLICEADSKSDKLPLTLTLSTTTAPVVEFQPKPLPDGTRSSNARLVLTRRTTRTLDHEAPAGIAKPPVFAVAATPVTENS